MPPKKKARGPSRSRESQSVAATPGRSELSTADVVSDLWTDEQETSLFKGMVRWKPVGMHKHFRMIAISQQLRNHGYTSPADGHTRIPGIWKKLESLYNMEALDERENSFIDEDAEETDPVTERFYEFKLPEDEYGELQFERRLAEEPSSSPPMLNYLQPSAPKRGARSATRGRASTLDETEEEPMSSPAPSRQRKGTRPVRGSRVGTRSRAHAEEKPSTKRKSGRIASTVEEDEAEGSAEEEEEESEEESEKEESAEESAAESPTPTPRTPAKAARGSRSRKSQGGTRRSTRKK
ncbi:CT20-domain-containing protein [Xylona heveae TC161]|uniref:CT20-domain-containing protein n=1 Tax=Xylona heveae (strain CBS 132557 / TC161) TaxID=1328760 RepID=A0A161TCA2_XYLHT|nr:CT20-domain-containing protein [Xylona heveae TC161]KZF23397.1 CT20-domain-containing protein [Xylona heveae TC161]